MSLWGGGFAEDLFGVQAGILTSGWVEGYNTSRCRMNGLQFAPFAVKMSMVDGFQIGLYNATRRGYCLQVGLINVIDRRRLSFFPVLNASFR